MVITKTILSEHIEMRSGDIVAKAVIGNCDLKAHVTWSFHHKREGLRHRELSMSMSLYDNMPELRVIAEQLLPKLVKAIERIYTPEPNPGALSICAPDSGRTV